MTKPDFTAATQSKSASRTTWVDNHLVLNSLAVLRHRVQAHQPDSIDALDALSGYFANGHYLQIRGSIARLDYWVDWFECSLGLLVLMHKISAVPAMSADLGDSDDELDLDLLGTLSARMLERLSLHPDILLREVAIRFDGHVLQLAMRGEKVEDLLAGLSTASGVSLDAGRDTVVAVTLR